MSLGGAHVFLLFIYPYGIVMHRLIAIELDRSIFHTSNVIWHPIGVETL